MRSSNDSKLIVGMVQYLIISILLVALFVQTDIRIKDLNRDIAILKLDNSEYKYDLEVLKLRIENYEIENKETQDIKPSSYTVEASQMIYEEKVDRDDLILLAQLIDSESGTQNFEGKLAVGTVVMNRVNSDEFPDTIRDVIFQKGQFSVVPNGRIYNEPSEESMKAAAEILDGKRTLGPDVLYFYNPKLTSKTNWIRTRTVDRTIEDHRFAS